MQAIEVKQRMDVNGNSKFIASCQAGRITLFRCDLERETSLSGLEQGYDTYCELIAKRLAARLNWNDEALYGKMHMGKLKNGNAVFVFVK